MKKQQTTPQPSNTEGHEGKHTQGEITFDGLEIILSDKGKVIADIRSCNHDGDEIDNLVYNDSIEEAEANAARIVYAWNNIDKAEREQKLWYDRWAQTENEKDKFITENEALKEARSESMKHISILNGEITELREVNGELLEALKELQLDSVDNQLMPKTPKVATIRKAQQTISKHSKQ
jgi:hypothetical protein